MLLVQLGGLLRELFLLLCQLLGGCGLGGGGGGLLLGELYLLLLGGNGGVGVAYLALEVIYVVAVTGYVFLQVFDVRVDAALHILLAQLLVAVHLVENVLIAFEGGGDLLLYLILQVGNLVIDLLAELRVLCHAVAARHFENGFIYVAYLADGFQYHLADMLLQHPQFVECVLLLLVGHYDGLALVQFIVGIPIGIVAELTPVLQFADGFEVGDALHHVVDVVVDGVGVLVLGVEILVGLGASEGVRLQPADYLAALLGHFLFYVGLCLHDFEHFLLGGGA